jgi:hypothetical protein
VSDFREYENGVADVLAYLGRESWTVERNVKIRGRRTGAPRQVDVLLRGRMTGIGDATMAVECKRWKRAVDVEDVEAFITKLDDVGADLGLFVTNIGASEAARATARQARGVRVEVLSLGELIRWAPKGTVTATYGVPADRQAEAEKVLREAGFRVSETSAYEASEGEVLLAAARHYGTEHPSGEVQTWHLETAAAALRSIQVEPRSVANGVGMGGGTPAHQWLLVTMDGALTDMKVLAGSEAEVDEELDRCASAFGVARSRLSVVRREGWPVTDIFGLP